MYSAELKQYKTLLEAYQGLTDNDPAQAFNIMQDALNLAERFSEIHFDVRREEKIIKVKDAALKDRMEQIYKILREIHTGCRMIWARGENAR